MELVSYKKEWHSLLAMPVFNEPIGIGINIRNTIERLIIERNLEGLAYRINLIGDTRDGYIEIHIRYKEFNVSDRIYASDMNARNMPFAAWQHAISQVTELLFDSVQRMIEQNILP